MMAVENLSLNTLTPCNAAEEDVHMWIWKRAQRVHVSSQQTRSLKHRWKTNSKWMLR